MSDLKKSFEALLMFAKEHNFALPFSQVYFVEDKEIKFLPDSNLNKIPREALLSFESYEKRFNALFNQGHSWINMYLAGVLKDFLLVIIETPEYENNVPREFVSVKYSLPEKRISENKWRVESSYEIVD